MPVTTFTICIEVEHVDPYIVDQHAVSVALKDVPAMANHLVAHQWKVLRNKDGVVIGNIRRHA